MKRARRVSGERTRAGAPEFNRSRRLAACVAASLACSVSASVARAESSRRLEELAELSGVRQSAPAVQWNVGLLLGPCAVGSKSEVWESTRACAAVRSDVFFWRRREASWGLGPYASAGTAGFDDARLGAGLSVLAPVVEDFPLVASLGGLAVLGDDRDAAPGVEAWLFWGARSFNFHGSYALANGVLLGAQTTFEAQRRHAVWLAVELDAAIPLLPFVLLAGWLRGTPP